MDISVLERQKAILQRLHSSKNQEDHHHAARVNLHSVSDHQQDILSNRWHPVKAAHQSSGATNQRCFSSVSSSNNSSLASVTIPKTDSQCNSSLVDRGCNVSCSATKRKAAEFSLGDECKNKGLVAEEAGDEKSEVTTKTERESSKVSEVPKSDYIHVRARRGQATDSHSLAERARREKISKKMKCLQDLVPSCNKVTGKAGILDEIINYVQSLQKQVEFLSMKLAVSNPRLDFSVDDFFTKEFPSYFTKTPQTPAATDFEATNSPCFRYNPMQQGTSNCGTDLISKESQMETQNEGSSSVPAAEVFLDSASIPQLLQISGWDSEFQNLFNTGFHY